jgi:TPR repeat protein
MNAKPFILLLMLAGSVAAQTAIAAASDDPRTENDFLTYHPDMSNRKLGMEAYRHANFVVAADYFRRAARYADKASEAMLAQMYWQGEGVAMDRPLAYAWMDLAAERGYPSLLAMREGYWQQMNANEQAQAVEVGLSVYAEYGDSVAKPRLAVQLRRGLMAATGSHLGYVGTLNIVPNKPVCNTGAGCNGNSLAIAGGIPGDQYYAPQYWKEKEYYAWQDAVWNVPPRHGEVNVGRLESVHDDTAPAPGLPKTDHDSQVE